MFIELSSVHLKTSNQEKKILDNCFKDQLPNLRDINLINKMNNYYYYYFKVAFTTTTTATSS